MRARLMAGTIAASLALLGASAAAFAATHPRPDPNALWRAYPLGTQPLATGGAPAAPTTGRPSSAPSPRRAQASSFAPGLTLMLIGAAVLCTLAVVLPVAVRRRRAPAHPIAPRAMGAPIAANGRPVNGVASAAGDVVAVRPLRSARPPAARDDEILRLAAAYADASRHGDSAPMAAVRAIVPAGTVDPAGHARRAIAAARRRGLLTSRGRGRAGGELTPKAVELLRERAAAVSAPERIEGAPAHEPAVAGLREDLPVFEYDGSA
jgi:hypothetical protein